MQIMTKFVEYHEDYRNEPNYKFLRTDLLSTFDHLVSIAAYCKYNLSEQIKVDPENDFTESNANYAIFEKPWPRYIKKFKNSYGIVDLQMKTKKMIYDHPYDKESDKIYLSKKKLYDCNILHIAAKQLDKEDYDDY